MTLLRCFSLLCLSLLLINCGGGGGSGGGGGTVMPQPTVEPEDFDLLEMDTDAGLLRLYGSDGTGRFGVPVAGGVDVNDDGFLDYAMASILASPQGRIQAGQVYLVLGDGNVSGTVDSALDPDNLLTFIGDVQDEMAGAEIWMDDVTGDGIGDLLINRQNYTHPGRIGSGALTIIVGSSELTTLAAAADTVVDLRSPPAALNVITFVGAATLDRLGMWVRTGDITGDGTADIAVSADQTDTQGTNSGTTYVIRGGSHLNTTTTIDLADIAGSALAGDIATVLPPTHTGRFNYHFGATLGIADLDENGTAELLVGGTINRAGAGIEADGAPIGSAEASGGSSVGTLFILWDDNFSGTWADDLTVVADETAPGGLTVINGTTTSDYDNDFFGEEMLGGLDYDDDGNADLFVGDIAGDRTGISNAGLGFVFFNSALLKDEDFIVTSPPTGVSVTTILGPGVGAIASDTALHGDFDNDGIADLAISSPHYAALGRPDAGALHILWGQETWPATIDLIPDNQPAPEAFRMTNIWGAYGTRNNGANRGDTLAYSAAAGDMDGDGFDDLIVNEMVGDGATAAAIDAGNLIILSGARVSGMQ